MSRSWLKVKLSDEFAGAADFGAGVDGVVWDDEDIESESLVASCLAWEPNRMTWLSRSLYSALRYCFKVLRALSIMVLAHSRKAIGALFLLARSRLG